MLYKYEFVKNKKMHELNQHFLYFIRRIKNVQKNEKFIPIKYFHSAFLNTIGEIAPKGKFNKSLDEGFKAFFDSFKKIAQPQKDEFYQLIIFSNDIHLYFEDNSVTEVINLRNDNIKRIIGNDSFYLLMKQLWSYLSSSNNAWEIDKHYAEFYNKLPLSKMCPFCGIEKLSKPDFYRADYDHLADKANYPITAISLKNMAPSCSDCNQKFKKSKDVFFDDSGIRNQFIYPYSTSQFIEIDFTGSIIPNTDITNTKGNWEITIKPNNGFTRTWIHIYKIIDRYKDAIKHEKWMMEFVENLKINKVKFDSYSEFQNYLNTYKEIFNPNKIQVEYHLRYAYLEYLANSNNNIFYSQIIKAIA